MTPWFGEPTPPEVPLTRAGRLRLLWRALVLALVVYGGLALFLALRVIEKPLYGLRRPWTLTVQRITFRTCFRVIGMGYRVRGTPMEASGAVVANHAGWLDILTLSACQRVTFVSKDDVAGWPALGFLARVTGTVFIRRDPKEAQEQQAYLTTLLRDGAPLLFFPEGTSSDGRRVLPFKSTLFQMFFAEDLKNRIAVQPVSVVYHAPQGAHPAFYGWWGDMTFGGHAVQVLSAARQGSVEVIFHTPLKVSDYPSRKALASACEAAVRQGLEAALAR